jgi:hypothetical protein
MEAGRLAKGAALGCASLLAALLAACSRPEEPGDAGWSPEAAAAYLDQREGWWRGWREAARDHETFCVSCHTALPYALSRPALRRALAESSRAVEERALLDNVRKRVRLGSEIGPYYREGSNKVEESRGTEAVLNALVLATYDAELGRLSLDARMAFANLWELQRTEGDDAGGWSWLNFGLRPWEASDSPYFGAALAAAAVGTAPESYRSEPEIRENLARLRGYLERHYTEQSLHHRTVLLWASTKLTGLLSPERREALVGEILAAQRRDGGWSVSSLNRSWAGSSLRSYVRSWVRSDGTLVDAESDGYATGLVTFTLLRAGVPRENVALHRGLSWLARHQSREHGDWRASSLNRRRSPSSNVGRFMSDAATAYAALALTEAHPMDAARGGLAPTLRPEHDVGRFARHADHPLDLRFGDDERRREEDGVARRGIGAGGRARPRHHAALQHLGLEARGHPAVGGEVPLGRLVLDELDGG